MRKYLYILLLIVFYSTVFSQQYQNSWIVPGKTYYRIFIVKDGVYRIDASTLANAGINLSSTSASLFQIFGRGKEDSIYIYDANNNNKIDPGDYIEFYAMHNTGWYDSTLYQKPRSVQPNPNYSMFNDTAIYYLTINTGGVPGKRMIVKNNTNFSSYSPVAYINKVSRQDYTSTYFMGYTDSNELTDPKYLSSEGWFDPGFYFNYTTLTPENDTKYVPTPNAYLGTPAPNAMINFLLLGESNSSAYPNNHHITLSFAGINVDTMLNSFYTLNYQRTVRNSFLGSPNTTFTFSTQNISGNNADGNTIAFINIKYPHTLDLEADSSFTMYVPPAASPATMTYLKMSDFSSLPTDSIIFYDLTNNYRINVVKNGSYFQVLAPNGSGSEKKCYMTCVSKINQVTSLSPVTFTDFSTYSNTNYIIITHQSLIGSLGSGGAYDFAKYRASPAGGSYSTLVVDVNELYDQFSYGIRKDPVAIKNFANYAYHKFTNRPKDIFIIGKGLQATEYRNLPGEYALTLVPGFGEPPSDILFTAFTNSFNDFKPWIPIGRLAARSLTDVKAYYNKVKEYELAQASAINCVDDEWMKYVLHFAGGSDNSQEMVLAAYLKGYQKIIQGPYFGGYVRTFTKSSSAPIQINISDSLTNIINNGVSLMTFFGHGAGVGFDVDIDDPSVYSNQGKYPFLLANSCLAGDLFEDSPTSSENFVLIPEKGTIGFLGSVTVGIDNLLDNYSTKFYRNIGVINYGQPIGLCIQNTIDSLDILPSDTANKLVCLDMTLHGDPAIKMNNFSLPDYMMAPPNVYFTPAEVTSQDSVFTVNVILTNIGKALDTIFAVEVLRTYPDGITKADSVRFIKAPYYKDTIKFKFPVNYTKGLGLNTFTVTVDSRHQIQELCETNNTTTASLLIKSNDIIPIYPYEYAVVPSTNVTLKASTGDPFAPARNYIFEIDTTDAFNSPVKMSHIVNHTGGVVTWKPKLPITKDSIVYFWHVSVMPTGSKPTYKWKESSFQYITGQRGWAQAHFFQFKNDNYQYIKYNKPSRKFTFINNIISLSTSTFNQGYPPSSYGIEQEIIYVNGSMLNGCYWNCTEGLPGLKFMVFDAVTGNPWSNPYTGGVYPSEGPYNCYRCQPYTTYDFDFFITTFPDTMNKIASFISHIPTGDYVLVMSHLNDYCTQWHYSLLEAAFGTIGGSPSYSAANGFSDNAPYILFGQKGAHPGSRPYTLGNTTGALITEKDTIVSHWKSGYIKSEMIGPASRWNSLHWRVKSIDPNPKMDKKRLYVLGIRSNGITDTVMRNISYVHDSIDINNLQHLISSAKYPYLQLLMTTEDDSFHTPSQLVRWQVLFDGVPETALDPSVHYTFYKDTLQEGDSIHFSVATHNVSDYNMDSLLIHYWIVDQNRGLHQISSHKYRKHPAGDTLVSSFNFCTTGLSGLNSLWVEVNPNNNQPEEYHFNNIGNIYFDVTADKINPLLDVTFDGVHILNGDIVSAKPLIEIMLKDENKYLLMNKTIDTSLFNVFIQNPGAATANRIYFRSSSGIENMRFYPASSSANNTCRIEYNGNFPIDGTYTLIVHATDVSKNKSGSNDYQINFDVINKATITEVMNWPNPFTTATHFVFTLTGSVIPTYFKIQIMTITGKMVREIGMEELGPIHIGRNITQYAWDGKDDHGDRLANGVYLYRVTTNISGKSIDENPTDADQYFKKGWGKMYLMR